MTRQFEAYHQQRTSLLNQLHALDHSAFPIKLVTNSIKRMVKTLEKEMLQLENNIAKILKQDPVLYPRIKKVLSIKGVGLKTIAVLISETNGFVNIENQGQLVSYAGYDIIKHQSGQRIGTSKISKKGNAHIRRAMHMPALSAVSHRTPQLFELHQRLILKGKKKMQAYVAVQRKLLILIWTLWKNNETFDPDYRQENISGILEPKSSLSVAP